LNLTRLSSRAIKGCAAVQKQLCSKPKGYPFKLMAVVPDEGIQFFADVPLGRMLQIFFQSFRSDVVAGEINRAGAGCEP